MSCSEEGEVIKEQRDRRVLARKLSLFKRLLFVTMETQREAPLCYP